MNEWERRAIPGELELRSREAERAVIAGYGIVFDKPSENLGGFVEVVKPQAVARTISQRDIRCLVNHDPNWPLGRTGNGSMRLRADSRGLEYEVDVDLRDPDGLRAVSKVESGLLDGSSFSFRVVKGGASWAANEHGVAQRTLTEVKIRDIGPATFPAYPESSVGMALRSLSEETGLSEEELEALAGADKLRELLERRAALPPHGTATTDAAWDGPGAVAAVAAEAVALRSLHAWVDPEGDADAKSSYKFPHHASPGGPANTRACSAGMAVLNGGRGGADIPDADRAGVWRHLARHMRDAGMEPPELRTDNWAEDPAETTPLLSVALRLRNLRERKYSQALG